MTRLRFPLVAMLLTALGGCSLLGLGSDSPEEARIEELKVPPDLEVEERGGSLSVPESGTVTASGDRGPVLPQPRRVSVQRVGGDRWLSVAAGPPEVWGWLGDFLERQGVEIDRRREDLGILETEWLYTNKPLARGAFAPVLPGPEDATVADRYLLRVEPGGEVGTADVFVAHRRAARRGDDGWQLLGPDPFLEAEVLRSLLIYLGVQAEESFERVAEPAPAGPGAELIRAESGALGIVLGSTFFDAWRRVGLALDRAAFTVAARERSERYVDIRYDTRAQTGPEEAGFFESIAFWRDEPIPETVETFRLRFVEGAEDGTTRVTLTRPDGGSVPAELNEEILGLLAEQIR